MTEVNSAGGRMKKITRYVLAVPVILISLATGAYADPNTDDVHCYIVYNSMSASSDKAMATAGFMGQIYWVGRLDGRAPDFDLEKAIIAELPVMTGDFFRAEAKRCGDAMIQRGQGLTAMGTDLQKRGAEMMKEEKSPKL
jgi:hypothetical protein